MNPGILTPPTQFATMPRGLLGNPLPVRGPMRSFVGFDPRLYGAVAMWFDFSDTSTVTRDGNGLISAIRDKAASIVASQATAASRPSMGKINALACADWGQASNTKSLAFAATFCAELAFVASWDGGAAFSFQALASSLSGGIQGFNSVRWLTVVQGSICSDISVNGSLSSEAQRPNALPQMSRTSVVQAWGMVSVVASQINRVGGDRDLSGRGWIGRIGEVVGFSRLLDPYARRDLMTAMQAKWSVVQ